MKTTDFIECENKEAVWALDKPTPSVTWWYRLKSRNGQIMLTSETYDSKSNCKRAAVKFGKKYGIPVKFGW